MSYRMVEGDGLRTRYEDSPLVTVRSRPNGPLALEVTFQAEAAPAGAQVAFTRLLFEEVLEFRWIANDYEYFLSDQGDYEFALIEILDSGHIERLMDEGPYGEQPQGERLGGVIQEPDLRHFRIGFDGYGDFDVICLHVNVERFRAVSH